MKSKSQVKDNIGPLRVGNGRTSLERNIYGSDIELCLCVNILKENTGFIPDSFNFFRGAYQLRDYT